MKSSDAGPCKQHNHSLSHLTPLLLPVGVHPLSVDGPPKRVVDISYGQSRVGYFVVVFCTWETPGTMPNSHGGCCSLALGRSCSVALVPLPVLRVQRHLPPSCSRVIVQQRDPTPIDLEKESTINLAKVQHATWILSNSPWSFPGHIFVQYSS